MTERHLLCFLTYKKSPNLPLPSSPPNNTFSTVAHAQNRGARRDTSAILAALLRTTTLPSQSAAIAVYVNTEKIVLVFRFVQWFKMVVVEFRKQCRKEDSDTNL
jgi:hypothetical protein